MSFCRCKSGSEDSSSSDSDSSSSVKSSCKEQAAAESGVEYISEWVQDNKQEEDKKIEENGKQQEPTDGTSNKRKRKHSGSGKFTVWHFMYQQL